jgi:hypothetical protein
MIKTDYRDTNISRELYKHQTTTIQVTKSKRKSGVKRAVRQGCKWSLLLFNMYKEQAVNECKDIALELR